MPSIDRTVIIHRLKVDPNKKLVRQEKRIFNTERFAALAEEVEKLLKAGFIREVEYPKWVANAVMVKKASGK